MDDKNIFPLTQLLLATVGDGILSWMDHGSDLLWQFLRPEVTPNSITSQKRTYLNPSCLQTTSASRSSHWSSQMVPHLPSW